MMTILVHEHGESDKLRAEDSSLPQLGNGQVRLRLRKPARSVEHLGLTKAV